jgi:hypothetical protein
MISSSFGKITNEQGEIVAEGDCEVDEERASVTMRPLLDMPLLERTRGPMLLTLDDGKELLLTDRVIHFRVNLAGQAPGSVYRLYIAKQQGLSRWSPSWEREAPRPPAPSFDPAQDGPPSRGGEEEGGGGATAFRPEWRRVDAPAKDPDELPPEFRKD